MLDSFSKKNNIHIVIDQINYGILTNSNSLSVANAIARGIPNASIGNIWLPERGHYFNNFAYVNDTKINCIVVKKVSYATTHGDINAGRAVENTPNGRLFDIIDMPANEINSEWLSRRRLANARSSCLLLLESKIERYLARVKTFSGDEIFIPYMDKELRLCNTEQQHFTPAVLEWASIAGLTPAEAFKELTYKVSSVQLSVTRLNALWEKYVDKINALTDREEMMNLVNSQLEMELRAGVQ
jgi:hypothetical protein